jgi:mRNA interferase YafQ
MKGDWQDHRDCHVKPDLVLIYRLLGSDQRDRPCGHDG